MHKEILLIAYKGNSGGHHVTLNKPNTEKVTLSHSYVQPKIVLSEAGSIEGRER